MPWKRDWEAIMPERFAEGFDPAAVKAMMDAFDKVCEALRVPPTHDVLTEQLARLVIVQAETGERNPDKLCEMTLRALAYRR
jgi:hypothetical protein